MTALRGSFFLLLLVAFPVLLLTGSNALGGQTAYTYATDGRPLFVYDIRDKGELFPLKKFGEDDEHSTWTLRAKHRACLLSAGDYWATLLAGAPVNTSPARILVGTFDEDNAFAVSLYRDRAFTELTAGVLENRFPADADEPVAVIGIGRMDPPLVDHTGPLSILPANGESSHMTATLVHELGHAMGIASSRTDDAFPARLAHWDSFLYDSYGQQAGPNMKIIQGSGPVPEYFVIDETGYDPDQEGGYAYFQGPNTMEALGGNGILPDPRNVGHVPGLPINGFEDGERRPESEISHIELRNSMMSHQNYRNWGTYMEAELAALQDIGIPLDRKNFFGASIYMDGGTYEITEGFYARNAAGTAYLPGVYNTAPYAVGLHLYGAENTVTMKGDVLSSGYGSMGIRVDGWDNALTVAPGATIDVGGEEATGLAVAYGSGHSVALRGDVRAAGPGSVGIRFDFGDNMLGSIAEYRGSYIRTADGDDLDFDDTPELEGSLADSFNITGSITGGAAAIYIARNAHVGEIAVMRGALIQGDIISHWNPDASFVQYEGPGSDLTIPLTFGLMPDASGRATGVPDPDFFQSYQDAVTGEDSFTVRLAGGTLAYGGAMRVLSFTADSGTTLLAHVGGREPALINAPEIDLDAGSSVGVFAEAFTYGAPLGAEHTILRLESENLTDNATLLPPSGSFMRGFYDYTPTSLRWEGGDATRALVLGTRSSLSRERAASSAITAPTAIMTDARYARMVHDHAAGFFARNTSVAPEPDPASARDMPTASAETRASNVSLWLAPSYSDSRRHGSNRYTVRTPAVALGADVLFGESGFLGVGAYLSKPTYRSGDADIDAENITGLLYGGMRMPFGLELDGFASVGHTWYEQERSVHGERYDTDYSGEHFGVGLSLGRSFDLAANVTARPFVAYEFMRLHVEGYNEGDSGLFGLHVGTSRSSLHRLEAGTSVAYGLDGGFVEGRFFYSGLYGDRKPEADISMTGDASQYTMTGKGWAQDEHAGGVGIGFGVDLGETARLSGEYLFIGGEKVTTHQAGLMLTVPF